MAKYHKSFLEILQEEDILLKQYEAVSDEIVSNLYNSEDFLYSIDERKAFEEEVNRLRDIEKDIKAKLKENKKNLRRHIWTLFDE